MKNWKMVATIMVVLSAICMPARAELDLSANFGIMSDYIYRGFHQSDAAANGGIDLAAGPFYLGTWVADLDSGNGIEIDVYGGLAWEFDNGFSVYAGYTAYRYTEDDEGSLMTMAGTRMPVENDEVVSSWLYEYIGDAETPPDMIGGVTQLKDENDEGLGRYELSDAEYRALSTSVQDTIAGVKECVGNGFDQDYDEINLGVAYAKDDFSVSLDYAIGEHDNFCGAADNDYDIAMLTLDYKGAYVTFGTYGVIEDDVAKGDPEGDYVEVGYATTVNDIDFTVAIVDSDEDIDDETRLVLSVSYGFGL